MRAGGAGPRGYAVRALAGPLRSNTFTALRVASPRVPPHRPGRPDRQLRDFRVNRASRPLPRRAPHPAWGERPRRGPGGVRAGTTRGIAAARPTPGVLARGSLPHQLRARLHGLGLHPSPESWAYAHGAGRASWRVPHARQGARSSFSAFIRIASLLSVPSCPGSGFVSPREGEIGFAAGDAFLACHTVRFPYPVRPRERFGADRNDRRDDPLDGPERAA